MHTIDLETERLLLRGISDTEMNRIFSSYSKLDVMRMLGHRTERDFEKEEEKYKKGYASYNRRFILFLLITRNHGEIIGRCGLHNWNPDHHRAEIGYHMENEDFKRQGLMSEAARAIVAYGFDQLNINRIEALVGTQNNASLRIVEKLNFQQEGLLRQHHFADGVYEDSILLARLRFD